MPWVRLPPERFSAVLAGDVVKAKKPAPDIYLMAAKELGVPPEDCVVVEDSNNGVESAYGAGNEVRGDRQRLHPRRRFFACLHCADLPGGPGRGEVRGAAKTARRPRGPVRRKRYSPARTLAH